MIILCNILVPNDKLHAIPADTGKIIKPTPASDKVIEADAAAIFTTVSTDSKSMFSVL